MDKGLPDNPSRLEAASKWTRLRQGFAGQTLHDLKRAGQQGGSPTGQKLGRPNPSRFEAASNYTRIGASEAKDPENQ